MPKPKLLRIKNTTNLSTKDIRAIANFCMPDNVMPITWRLTVTNCRYAYRGRYLTSRMRPGVLVRIGNDKRFPMRANLYQYAQHKGKKVCLANRTEALVYVLAHELRHLWQQHGLMKASMFPVGSVRNSKGRFSEVDTEAYAVHTLRAWRKWKARRESNPKSRRSERRALSS